MKTQLALCTAILAMLLPAASHAQQTAPAASGDVTVIGCLMREADYRTLMKDKPGLLASLGQGGEYVLVDAAPAAAARGQRARGAGAVGTAGAATRTYSLSGKLEDHLATDVGRMVEVVGKAENAKPDAMPKLTISVWHPVGDFCPAK
jgi:hypothetical protein